MRLIHELSRAHGRFEAGWKSDLSDSIAFFEDYIDDFEKSYRRISSIQSWRANILENEFKGNKALGFFEEAQNDLISGHVIARAGSWRYALKGVRSFLENSLSFLYFKDHPIELEKWSLGRFKIGFSELEGYLRSHPSLHGFSDVESGIASLKKEYGILSRAVHASASDFRMTQMGEVNRAFITDPIRMRKWLKRESETIMAVNTLYLYFFRDLLQGASHRNHRKIIGVSYPVAKVASLKNRISVNIITP